jgi:hypothetical protein
MSYDQRLYGFIFDPAAGVSTQAVLSLFDGTQQALLVNANEQQLRRLATLKINRNYPIKELPLANFAESITQKLPLLTMQEWRLLGLGVALMPFVGRIARSMDGNFRRGIRTVLNEVEVEALDGLTNDTELMSIKPVFQAPSTVWKNMEIVHTAGIQAIQEQLCQWPESVAVRTLWKFTSAENKTGSIVTGLKSQHIEALCRILLPDHPWLLSSNQTH